MIWTLGVIPFSLLAIGTPIFVLLLAGGVLTFLFFLTVSPVAIHQIMFGGLENYALLAIPFFIFAGELMGAAGIADRLIVWVLALIGRVPGSLGVATVGASTLIGAISGASVATVAAVGKALYPGLIRDGYGARFSSGLVSSSGAIDILIPPSIAMILYGAAAEQSIPKLFVAGVLPGLLIALMMAAYVVVRAVQLDIPRSGRFDLREFACTSWRAAPALFMPAFVLGIIYFGYSSPTEAGGFACVYAMIVGRYIYRSMSWQDVLNAAARSAMLTAQILVIVATAALFSWILTISGVPRGL
jgi:C4-dicarboxylate transporter DctM subunit